MEEFINKNTEIILEYKKNIWRQSNAYEFVKKLPLREKEDEIRNELEKCLLSDKVKDEKQRQERKKYILTFLSELKKLKNDEKEKQKEEKPKKEKTLEQMLMPKINDENFPPLHSAELVEKTRKNKQFKVLDKHYKNKLEKGTFDCFCYGERHPLVGICLNCGRIHCLQEGDKICICCGKKLLNNNEYLNNIVHDFNAKNAYYHKEKLLKFQENFYSKLQIIDDYNDWYEISNNTWLGDKERMYAKLKDDDSAITELIIN